MNCNLKVKGKTWSRGPNRNFPLAVNAILNDDVTMICLENHRLNAGYFPAIDRILMGKHS